MIEVVFLSADDHARVTGVHRFSHDDIGIPLAVQRIADDNAKGFNAYVTVNPVKADVPVAQGKRASTEHIAAAFFQWADSDSPEAAENIRAFVGPKCTFSVMTGTVPNLRPHVYWELTQPETDLQAWSRRQAAIAAVLKTDKVIDPPRIMRIAGTVNYPKPQKAARGYLPELTTLRIFDPAQRPPVSTDAIDRAFATRHKPDRPQHTNPHGFTNFTNPVEAEVIEILQHLDPNCGYQEWFEILAGLHDRFAGSDTGFIIADEWSARSSKYVQGEVAAKWKSFKRGGITFNSVAAAAERNGADLKAIHRKHNPAPDPFASFNKPRRDKQDTNQGKQKPDPDPDPDRDTDSQQPEDDGFDTTPLDPAELVAIPPRRWLYGSKMVRGFVSIIASPGGTGKSALVTAIALDCATGFQTLNDKPHAKLKTWIYNLEDPRDETLRKIAAVIQYKHLPLDALQNIVISSGRDRKLIVAVEPERGVIVATPDVEAIIKAIKAARIDVLIVDPVIRSHQADENSNKTADFVMDLYARIADEADCAVVLVHHTRKGFVSGEADSIRGASALSSAARVVLTLQTMQPDEAERLNIQPDDRRRYIRIDSAKANLAMPSEAAEWIKLESHNIQNPTADYPDGDNVQVATAWQPPNPLNLVRSETFAIFARIERGHVDETGAATPYGSHRNSGDRWAGNAVLASFPNGELSDAQAQTCINRWIEEGLLEVRDHQKQGGNRAKTKCVFVKNIADRGNPN
jgi:hypothetical protein